MSGGFISSVRVFLRWIEMGWEVGVVWCGGDLGRRVEIKLWGECFKCNGV